MIGFELCGTYALNGSYLRGLMGRKAPLTTRKKLARFIGNAQGLPGREQAARALRYICEGSASPMETALAMILGLPPSLGGYGIGMPQMNYKVDTVSRRLDLYQTEYRKCDLFWGPSLTVEYDGAWDHAGREALEKDAIRRNDLFGEGIHSVTITARQIYNAELLHVRARQIAAFLKKQIRPRAKKYPDKQEYLRLVVLGGCSKARPPEQQG